VADSRFSFICVFMLEDLLEVTLEGCFRRVKDDEAGASFDTIFSYSMASWACDRLWCFIQLLWALVGVVPLDSALIAGNVGLATSNYFSRSQSLLIVFVAACWTSTCLTVHISCLISPLTRSRLFASLDNLSS
jgi:hypothetical protein